MTFRGLFISDIHCSNRLPLAKPTTNGMTDRLEDQMKLLDEVALNAHKYECDAVFILGDLLDQSRVDAVTLTETANKVRRISKIACTYILGGNHDAVSVKGGRFTVEAFGAFDVGVIQYLTDRKEGWSPGPDWLRFWPVEYAPIPDTQAMLASIRDRIIDSPRKHEIGLLHNSILGCGHEGWVCDDGLTPEEACGSFTYTIAGHFHTPQLFGGGRGMYCGSPLHFRFDDRDRKAGYWIIDFEKDGGLKRRFIDPHLPKFHIAKWPEMPRRVSAGDYVRFEVEATHAEWLTIKPKVQEEVRYLCDKGARADYKHKPLYHHIKRIKKGELSSKISPVDLVDGYVDELAVDTTGLDKKKLKELGRRALEEARNKKATS